MNLSSVVNQRSLWETLNDPDAIQQLRGGAKNALRRFVLLIQELFEASETGVEGQLETFRNTLESLKILELSSLYVRGRTSLKAQEF